MKKIVLAAIALGLGLSLSAAEGVAEAPKSAYSVTLDFPFASKYTFRGVQLAEQSIQPSIEVTYTDFYAGVWTNQPVTSNIDNEVDFYLGYKFNLNDKWNVDLGATMYYYPELDKSSGLHRETYETYLGVNANLKGFTPGVYVYHDVTLHTTTMQGQVGYSLPLASTGASLDFTGSYGRVFAHNAANYNYWNVGVTVPYKLSEKATVYAGVNYTNNDIDNAEGDFLTWNAGVTVGF